MMSDVIDLTERLKAKEFDATKDESAQEWTPIEATNQASEWMAERGADMCIIIWTEPEEPVIDGTELAVPRPIYYIISRMDRSDALAMAVHLFKRLITDWF